MTGRRQEQSGFALLLVLMLVATAAILGVSYVASNATRGASATNLVSATRARYVAECGLEHSLYLLQNNPALIANSTNTSALGPFYVDNTNESYTVYASPGAGAGHLYTLIAVGTSKGVSQKSSLTIHAENRYANQVLALSPVAYWRLGETSGAAALDVVGAHAGVYMNGVSLGQPGVLIGSSNRAAHFDGVNDHVDSGEWDVGGGAITLLAWFSATEGAIDRAWIVSKAKGAPDGDQYWTLCANRKDGKGRLTFFLRTDNHTDKLEADCWDIEAGQWTFAAAVYDGASMILYENGVEVGRRAKTGN
ncbi:MAG TPA: LamG-like jellyroll fold domain-containing protein, partial [Phycisphaerae bacterium]|nr:LamG-like jellyroll fold domain-containing protein [Phycisphaerae bacterium]